jgi:hypothetical protein
MKNQRDVRSHLLAILQKLVTAGKELHKAGRRDAARRRHEYIVHILCTERKRNEERRTVDSTKSIFQPCAFFALFASRFLLEVLLICSFFEVSSGVGILRVDLYRLTSRAQGSKGKHLFFKTTHGREKKFEAASNMRMGDMIRRTWQGCAGVY